MPTTTRMLWMAKRIVKGVLRPLSRPCVDRGKILADLRTLGVRQGGVLLVHSALSALGYVAGGPRAVLGALAEAVGPDGTLVLPTHTWEWMDAGGRTFDARSTPACVGAIPEAFRALPGVVRSLHPTHSVAALGPRARWFVEGHEGSETPCGAGTPYAKLLEEDGQILLLGVGLESHTAYHTIEANAGVPYLLAEGRDEFTIIDGDGARRVLDVRRHRPGVARRFGALEGWLMERGAAVKGNVGGAPALLVAGAVFLDVMTAAVREDPGFLLDRRDGREATRTS